MTGSTITAGALAGDSQAPGTPAASPSAHDWRLKALAWGLMMAASLFNLLNFNGYSLFRPEVGLVLATVGLVAVVLARVERVIPRLGFVFTGALVWMGADLNSESTDIPRMLGLAALVFAWYFNTHVVKLAIAVFGTIAAIQFVTATIGLAEARAEAGHAAREPAANQAALPPVIHLVLDSALGMEGMASDPSLADLYAHTEEFYENRGFRLYHDAYSRHANTANSIPYILSFGNAPLARTAQRYERHLPPKLDYFQLLSDRGYKVSVLGANYLDLCTGQAVAECRQEPHSPLSAITEFPMSTRDRAFTIGIALANMSWLTTNAYEKTALLVPYLGGSDRIPMRNLQKIASIASVSMLRDLEATLVRPQPGHAYFVHLLMPHEPYVFDRNCGLKQRSGWTTERSPVPRPTREGDYSEQTRCMNKLLGDMLSKLDRTATGRRTIVIFHGDHGSRIVDERPLAVKNKGGIHDVAMTFSTLFAIRAPGVEPGVASGRASLDELLQAFATNNFAAAPPAGVADAEIILATKDWVPKRRVALPEYASN